MAKGFYQALFLTQLGPTLNINLAFTCFYMPLGFVEFTSKYLRKDVTQGISQRDLEQFQKLIANLKSKFNEVKFFTRLFSKFLVETMHTGRRIFYRFRGFGRSANDITFPCNEDGPESITKQISVADYFAKKFRRLMHPRLPCINAMKGNDNKPNWLPMEVVRVSHSSNQRMSSGIL